MATNLRVLILGSDAAEVDDLKRDLSAGPFEVEGQVMESERLLTFNTAQTDIAVMCMPQGFQPMEGRDQVTLHMPNRPMLFIMSNPNDRTRLWAFQHGASEILIRPIPQHSLFTALQLVESSHPALARDAWSDDSMISLLKALTESGVDVIEPSLDPAHVYGHTYGHVAQVLGPEVNALECLERLASEGLATRSLANRLRLCPVCSKGRINYRETCPQCGSIDVAHEDMLHHFPCAHIGPLTDFQNDGELVCPKCRKTLRHIGVDYEKPAGQFQCRHDGFIFAEPNVEAQCLTCSNTCNPSDTFQKIIYTYTLTPLAEEAAREGRIRGADLATILKSKFTGLYTRQYFEHEMAREMARAKRYSEALTLALVEIENFENVTSAHPARAAEYAESVFTAISKDLRVLDATCVWGSNILGVLLPGTPEDGAKIVTQRMYERVAALEHLYSIQQPAIAVGLVSYDDSLNTPQDMLDAAAKELGHE